LLDSGEIGRIIEWRRGVPGLPIAAASLMLTLAHHTKKAENNKHCEPLAEKAPFHYVASLGDFSGIATPAVSEKRKPLSMTSEVMEKRSLWTAQMLKRTVSQAIQQSARGFICREKTFNAEFLQCNVLRRTEGSKRRKQAQR
jgi:hypothetical protein